MTLLDVFKQTYSDGPAEFQGGEVILRCITWDEYVRWREISPSGEYSWMIDVAMFAFDRTTARVRQTVSLHSWNKVKKHEAVFAFRLADLSEVRVQQFTGRHPANGNFGSNYEQSKFRDRPWPTGAPCAVTLSFKYPINIRRWSCLPITDEPLEAELSAFTIDLWLSNAKTAHLARATLLELAAKAESDEGHVGESAPLLTPGFGDVPMSPPGSVRRDF